MKPCSKRKQKHLKNQKISRSAFKSKTKLSKTRWTRTNEASETGFKPVKRHWANCMVLTAINPGRSNKLSRVELNSFFHRQQSQLKLCRVTDQILKLHWAASKQRFNKHSQADNQIARDNPPTTSTVFSLQPTSFSHLLSHKHSQISSNNSRLLR